MSVRDEGNSYFPAKQRIQDAAGDTESRRTEQALQLGVALLEGKEVL